MIFENPVIKFLVVVDGPACFDIAQERNLQIDKIETGNSVEMSAPEPPQCGCPGQCTCECRCPCKCECQCTCQCMCRCECKCEGTCPCKNVAMPDKEDAGAPIQFGSDMMIRREVFGGLLFNKKTFSSFVCNHSAFEIISYIQHKGNFYVADLSALANHIRTVFEETPEEIEEILFIFSSACTKHRFLVCEARA